jgi:hypothetical protein
MTYKEVAQYYRPLVGRPCCIFCCWNPWPNDYKNGSGFINEYPDNVWSDHIRDKHPFALDPNRRKIIHWAPGVWKWADEATPEELAEAMENKK